MTKVNNVNPTLKGVLLNNYIRKNNIHPDSIEANINLSDTDILNVEDSYNKSKILKPLLFATTVLAGGSLLISEILKKSSSNLLNTKNFEQLPDLAVNMNIKEEPQFAIYRAIRDPNFKNILAMSAVFVMSGITIACKNFVDGIKEIWVRKQKADIDKNLQDNLIKVEKDSFAGKLDVIQNMFNKNSNYFDEKLNDNPYKNFLSFKGVDKNDDKNNIKNNDILYMGLSVLTVGLCFLFGKKSLDNIKYTAQNTNKYANNVCENAIDMIEKISKKQDENDLPKIIELSKLICAKPDYIKTIGEKYNLSDVEIQKIINETEESKKTIFADAPQALGGIPKKIQYYCYLDENRGHLYNWVLNPDNKFTKYVFLAFSLASAIGYSFKQAMDAIKEVAVLKENAKTELNLRKRLVKTEIENFKAKKNAAINPYLEDFELRLNKNVSKQELRKQADNILLEIKNGPPYVYA